MTALLSFLLGNPALLRLMASFIAALGWGFHQRLAGARAERARQAAGETAARDVADQVDNDIAALPADAIRKELKSWARN
ncbi:MULTISPECIES: ABC transporter permease [unclassified Mesorhizobium]|nr:MULTISPECIES: ABC transporter permease [unclassified Mesorhizobium]TGT56807.1 ABC transporter permease [Mesorhizobium sp. M00.F.Ca.ET.170.01.1.1]AZO08576.1 ABC transporter permease [Mesorhizobium sp. M3A.F.Ca.ET.080.04.2.1]PBB85453.1 ABC transporter permease [Mesorhizobium sp. WSM3876]RWB85054.1 MAG: ABC transporter permease [Mesorhizobium sp.]RWE20296.1 MAG: ABC transporter permease [Mesorhizobium sp.]